MALALAAVLVAASAPGLQIDWQAPAGCPQAAELRARIDSLVGAAAVRADLTVRGRVTASGEKWTLTLELVREGSAETRTLEDRACRGVAEAAAVVIAVAIDPRAGTPVVPEAPVPGVGAGVPEGPVPGDSSLVPAVRDDRVAPVPGDSSVVPAVRDDQVAPVPGDSSVVPPGPVPGDSSVVPPGPATDRDAPAVGEDAAARPGAKDVSRRTERWTLGLRVGGGVGFARLLPGAHGVLDAGLGLGGRGWRVEGSGLFVPPVRASASEAIGGVFRLGAGELRGCGVPALRRAAIGFPVCAGLQLGAMYGRGEGTGLAETAARRALWAAMRLGAAIRWRPRDGAVALWLGVDAIVALTRPKFVTAGGVVVHEAARIGGQVSVGVEVLLRR
jgi:hypothetical protein